MDSGGDVQHDGNGLANLKNHCRPDVASDSGEAMRSPSREAKGREACSGEALELMVTGTCLSGVSKGRDVTMLVLNASRKDHDVK